MNGAACLGQLILATRGKNQTWERGVEILKIMDDIIYGWHLGTI